eukprot:NODE_6991_length_424_cov_14.298667_g5191_i1.p3 GENE.NODE_6991_length_424_cov_14.298667_g5191_i1~~NODE_6991_length_424_cov_14.298667_g5191_i1.p3  ORF type:complete len:83 (+),score=33.06 NODE_6991_length_424_cov_14.298667_g5191_i1:165-413(+)
MHVDPVFFFTTGLVCPHEHAWRFVLFSFVSFFFCFRFFVVWFLCEICRRAHVWVCVCARVCAFFFFFFFFDWRWSFSDFFPH